MKNTNIEPPLPRKTILQALMRFLFRMMMTALVFAFCFYLLMVSNMGETYFATINDGALDMPIRIALIGISAWIAMSVITWLVWRTFKDGKRAYQMVKK